MKGKGRKGASSAFFFTQSFLPCPTYMPSIGYWILSTPLPAHNKRKSTRVKGPSSTIIMVVTRQGGLKGKHAEKGKGKVGCFKCEKESPQRSLPRPDQGGEKKLSTGQLRKHLINSMSK